MDRSTSVGSTHVTTRWLSCRRVLLIVLGVVVVIAAPVVSGVGGTPPEASIDRLEVADFSPTGADAWVSDVLAVSDVVMVGATVSTDAPVEVRAHDGDGWGPWLAFSDVHDHGPAEVRPDAHDGSRDHGQHAHGHDGHLDLSRRAHTDHHWGNPHHDAHGPPHDGEDHRWGSPHHLDRAGPADVHLDPLWVGASEHLQIRIRGDRPDHVTVDTVAMSPGQMRANEPTAPGRGAALASIGNPGIIPRDAWDPDGECRPAEAPESGEVRMAHVHHTVMYPTYAPEEADDVVRALCLFHVEARGFDDLGYNFMVDAYGRVYEGRAGGIDRAVVGSHAAGFNHVSAGISVMGDHETNPVSDETVRAIEGLLAWLFTTHRIDPLGTVVVESTGGAVPGLTPYEEGEEVEMPTIVGHRDTGTNTLCPGRYLYEAMDEVPPRVAELVLAAAQRPHDPTDDPTDERPRPVDDDGGVIEAAAPGPTLPITGWGGMAIALLPLGIAALVGERRWRGSSRVTG